MQLSGKSGVKQNQSNVASKESISKSSSPNMLQFSARYAKENFRVLRHLVVTLPAPILAIASNMLTK